MMNQKEHYGTYRFLGYFVPANNNNMERERKKYTILKLPIA